MKLPQSVEDLTKLVERHGPDAVAKQFRKPPIPSSLLREASQSSPSKSVWIFLARYMLTPSSVLEEMARQNADFPVSVLVVLAQNPRTPPTELSVLLHHPEAEVHAAVAANPNLPARDMAALLDQGNALVARALASNPSLKLNAQARLAAYGDPATRVALTQNKALHPDLWVALSSDPSPIVRFTLAAASHAPDDLLPFWADSDREEIQLALLSRSSLSEKLLKALLLSPHASVRQAAAEKLTLGDVEMLRLSQVDCVDERRVMAARTDVPAAIQHQLALDDSIEVREALAMNEAIWPEVAEFFVSGEDEEACLALLNNPAMPEALYVELAWQNKPRIIAALASNDRTPVEVLQYLVNERLSPEAIFHLAACQKKAVWMRGDLADSLANTVSPSLRCLAAHAQALSLQQRNLLKDDPAPRVKVAAYETTPDRTSPDEMSMPVSDKISACLAQLQNLIFKTPGEDDESVA
ncbi:hypothetical protein [Cerasicoccus maritimus]|uniref:hypothetical protein n=1 Tax=Cerasicoccus maritimus TaxID=490089 RepID=UPI0028529BD7|nr:hypothetical protein [Cerasicoccus maritimus]